MIVSNSSTLILLAKVQALPRFLDFAKKITISDTVRGEIDSKESFENSVIRKEIGNGRIIINKAEKGNYASIMKHFKLDEGESSTLALYNTGGFSLILSDDKEMIKYCRINEIRFTSAPAVIVRLFKKRKLTKLESLEMLEKLQGYGRYSTEIYEYFRNMVR